MVLSSTRKYDVGVIQFESSCAPVGETAQMSHIRTLFVNASKGRINIQQSTAEAEEAEEEQVNQGSYH